MESKGKAIKMFLLQALAKDIKTMEKGIRTAKKHISVVKDMMEQTRQMKHDDVESLLSENKELEEQFNKLWEEYVQRESTKRIEVANSIIE